MLTLYGCYRSRASRPLWLLTEIGMEFAHRPVIQAYRLADPDAADAPDNTRSPSFLAVNPLGQIPALTDGDLVLTESLAICLHIARAYGGVVGPTNLAEQALMEQWALFALAMIEGPAIEILYADAASDAGKATILAEAGKLMRPFARLEAHLTGRDWLLDRFSVADIMVAECVRYAQGHAPLMQAHPTLSAWLERCHARPAFQAMWAGRMAEPA
ncbi:glutathione S-transferase family protein [Gemmobacter denitrificans]|uniref:Glutathione S-transferase family protein n=1 Tax=Gemmobacter denitrificans TaxID=3123040 RepID=A0ABU8BSC3_9RHOB